MLERKVHGMQACEQAISDEALGRGDSVHTVGEEENPKGARRRVYLW